MRGLPLLCCLLLLFSSVRAQAADWSVRLQVYSTQGEPTVEVSVLGERRTVTMADEGQGLWSGTVQTPPARLMPVTLSSGTAVVHDLVVLEYGEQTVVWQNESPGEFRRASEPVSSDDIAASESTHLILAAVWTVCVGWLIIGNRRQRDGPAVSWSPGPWQSLLLWLLMSVLWTWPAVLSNDWFIVGRHFDLPGTLWVIGAAPRLMNGLSDPMTAWPMGADLSRIDSFLLLPISAVFSWLGPGRIHGLLQVFGVALSAFAAQRFARAAGARAPWTLLAGFGYAFSGLSATALLEGHVYHVFNPWLPLFGWMMWRAAEADVSRRWGMGAVVFFALCWLTTGYAGVVATLLLAAFVLRSPRSLVPVVAGCGAVITAYGAWYFGGEAAGRNLLERLHPVSAHLAGMLAPTPELDRTEHSLAPVLLAWMMALVVIAPRVLGRENGRWRTLWLAGLAGLVLSMLPQLAASSDLVLFRLELDAVSGGPLAGLLRFPARFGWLWSLCGGVVAAKVATRLAPQWGRAGWLLLFVVVVEAFIRVGTPLRQVARYGGSSTLYAQAEGPVLELLPVAEDSGENMDRWMANFSCMSQATHGQVLTEDCVQTRPRQVRQTLNLWLQDRLLTGRMDDVNLRLQSMGVRGVSIRPDLFESTDRATLVQGLAVLDPRPLRDTGGGAGTQLYTLNPASVDDPTTAYTTLKVPDSPRSSVRAWAASGGQGRSNGVVALLSWLLIVVAWTVAYRRS